jgi:hypothetical protein
MHSRATTEGVRPNARENSQIRPSTIVRAARAAGSHPHLASVLLQGLKSANIYASSGVIRGIPAKMKAAVTGGLSKMKAALTGGFKAADPDTNSPVVNVEVFQGSDFDAVWLTGHTGNPIA